MSANFLVENELLSKKVIKIVFLLVLSAKMFTQKNLSRNGSTGFIDLLDQGNS